MGDLQSVDGPDHCLVLIIHPSSLSLFFFSLQILSFSSSKGYCGFSPTEGFCGILKPFKLFYIPFRTDRTKSNVSLIQVNLPTDNHAGSKLRALESASPWSPKMPKQPRTRKMRCHGAIDNIQCWTQPNSRAFQRSEFSAPNSAGTLGEEQFDMFVSCRN